MVDETTEAGSSPKEQESSVTPESQPVSEGVKEESPPSTDASKESESSTEKGVVDAVNAALQPETEEPEASKTPETVKTEEPEPSKQAEQPSVKEEEKPLTTEDLYEEPEGLKPKGQERFRSLVEDNKSTKAQLVDASQAIQEIQTTVQSSGMSPEQFGSMIEYGRLVHSADKKDLEVAYKMARNESRKLALELGIQDDGVDLLEDFPDLKEKRESLEITEEAALELAKLRRRETELTKQSERVLEDQNKTAVLETEKTDALKQVKDFMVSKKQTDIDFEHKETVLLSKVGDIRKNFDPKDWPKVIAQLYDTIGAGASDARESLKKNSQQPVASANSTPAGENHKSPLDAIRAVLG